MHNESVYRMQVAMLHYNFDVMPLTIQFSKHLLPSTKKCPFGSYVMRCLVYVYSLSQKLAPYL